MPLTKANSVVLNIDDVSLALRDSLVSDGVRDYIDEQISIVSDNLDSAVATLTSDYQAADTIINATISANYIALNDAINTEITNRIAAIGVIQAASVPVGSVILWSSPTGTMPDPAKYGYYAIANNASFSIPGVGHPLRELYNIFGTTFNLVGDSGIFRLPDYKGRVIVGAGGTTDSRGESRNFPMNSTGGEFRHVLTVAELASHTHKALGQTPGQHGGGGALNIDAMIGSNTDIQYTGSDAPHNNIQPYLTQYYIIKISHTDWNV
jgi:microcystin-dependent protein